MLVFWRDLGWATPTTDTLLRESRNCLQYLLPGRCTKNNNNIWIPTLKIYSQLKSTSSVLFSTTIPSLGQYSVVEMAVWASNVKLEREDLTRWYIQHPCGPFNYRLHDNVHNTRNQLATLQQDLQQMRTMYQSYRDAESTAADIVHAEWQLHDRMYDPDSTEITQDWQHLHESKNNVPLRTLLDSWASPH